MDLRPSTTGVNFFLLQTNMTQLRRWAFTFFFPDGTSEGDITAIHVPAIQARLPAVAKAWVFQLESCPTTGRLHLQGRISFKTPARAREVGRRLGCPGAHASPEHDTVAGEFYSTKAETRRAGPWSNKDVRAAPPLQIARIRSLRRWQAEVRLLMRTFDDRVVECIVNPVGGCGKSALAGILESLGECSALPTTGSAKDLIRMAFGLWECGKPCGAFVLDFPRATIGGQGHAAREREREWYAAIECIKTGRLYDERYKFRSAYINCPSVWVFTNAEPDYTLLSADRWRVWNIEPSADGGRLYKLRGPATAYTDADVLGAIPVSFGAPPGPGAGGAGAPGAAGSDVVGDAAAGPVAAAPAAGPRVAGESEEEESSSDGSSRDISTDSSEGDDSRSPSPRDGRCLTAREALRHRWEEYWRQHGSFVDMTTVTSLSRTQEA